MTDVDLEQREEDTSELLVLRRVPTDTSIDHEVYERSREELLAKDNCLRRLPQCQRAHVAEGQQTAHAADEEVGPSVGGVSGTYAEHIKQKKAEEARRGEEHLMLTVPRPPLEPDGTEAARISQTAELMAIAPVTAWYDARHGP